MSQAHIGASGPGMFSLPRKSFSLRQLPQHLILGVPLALWAIALLLIAATAHFDLPVSAIEAQEFWGPF